MSLLGVISSDIMKRLSGTVRIHLADVILDVMDLYSNVQVQCNGWGVRLVLVISV